ncbi:hypothetical protein LPJ61_003646 [Coemansia biformis]|uniref:Major facilitator superfamily (MFS) profile domain-containing protein n=1 Tax=Coemansia biformis TaxID=1286918 RepID=A0A9W7YAU1_9FUNG|nr:hypothetical protein LPJ61_003646 [Coemansia biformis]
MDDCAKEATVGSSGGGLSDEERNAKDELKDVEQLLNRNILGQPQWPVHRTLAVFSGLSLTMYMVCTAETVFNHILGQLKEEFRTDIYAQWLESAFLLTCVMVQPIWVKLAERFGRVWPLLTSLAVFMAFSIMVGAARTMVVACVGRALQGVGGAGMMPLALVVLTDVLTPRQRPVYMGLLGAVIIIGKWTGPLVGAALQQGGHWRWAGYMHLPIGAVALLLLIYGLHDLPAPLGSKMRKLRSFDYLGTVLWLGGSLMILLALVWGGNEHPWRSATVVCLFVVGFIVILAFGAVEGLVARWPIIPLRVLMRPRTLLAIISSCFVGVCMYGLIMFVPVYYLMVIGESTHKASTHILWLALGGVIGSVVAGALAVVRGRVLIREWSVLGTAMMAIGLGLMYTWPLELSPARQVGFQVLVGLGLGFSMQQILLASQAGLPADEISTVTTLVDYSRTLGGMIGLVIGQVILKEKMFGTIHDQFGPLVELGGQDIVSLTSMMPMLQMLPALLSKPIYEGIVNALRLVYVADVPFAALACILCALIPNLPLHAILPAERPDEFFQAAQP